MLDKESPGWIDGLPYIISSYNRTTHSFTGFSPFEVEQSYTAQRRVLEKFIESYISVPKQSPKHKIGDKV